MNNFYSLAQSSFVGLGCRAGKMLRWAVLVTLGLMSTPSLLTAQTLDWNTFTGSTGTGIHEGNAVVTDASGNIYVCGSSNATFGTPINAKSGAYDGILVKYNSSGVRQWHTFFGGSGDDFAFGIDLDPSGNIYISGSSAASWGTPLNGFSGDPDGLVIKFNSSGVRQWHTFFGASFGENAYAIAVDASGNAYVTGNSQNNWGTPVEPYTGGTDGIVLKYNTSGARQWHSFFGGINNGDRGQGIALDASNNVYITGFSGQSWGSPIVAPAGSSDGVVAKYNGSTGDLVWNTYFGSSGADEGRNVVLDASGNIYVTGQAAATWGTPISAYSSAIDGVLVKFNSSGVRQWNTFLGGSGDDIGYGVAADGTGNMYITGSSTATWGTPINAYTSGGDGFVAKYNSSGARQFHTFFGGTGLDYGRGVTLDASNDVIVSANSNATWGTPVNAYAGSAGSQNIAVAKFSSSTATPGGIPGAIVWLKADAGTSTTTSGAGIATWTNQAGGGNAVQATTGSQPTYQNGSTNLMNFNPVVKLDAANSQFFDLSANIYGDGTARTAANMFTVVKHDSISLTGNNSLWWENGAAGRINQHFPNNGGSIAWDAGGFGTEERLTVSAAGANITSANPFLWSFLADGTNQSVKKNNDTLSSRTNAVIDYNFTNTSKYIGRNTGSVYFDGNVGEIIGYGTSLTATQIQKIESYLAIKYGTTLNQSTPTHYLASDGTIFWNNGINGYRTNIAGIARDDASGLNQKQSRSVNSGFQVTIANGNTVAATNALNTSNFTADKSALTWGNNGSGVNWVTNSTTPPGRQRLARIWRVQETGTVGSVRVQVPDNSASNGLPAEAGAVYLLVKSDNDFSTGATEIPMTLVGTNWEASVNFTHLQFFTFATNVTVDTDGDGIDNLSDLDDDNDGILDEAEGCGEIAGIDPSLGFLFTGDVLTGVYTVNLNNGATNLITTLTHLYNGVAINEDDNYFWGFDVNASTSTTKVFKIYDPTNWTVVHTISVPHSSTPGFISGAYDTQNKWYVVRQQTTGLMFVFDGDPDSPTYRTLLTSFTPSNAVNIPDFAYNQSDGLFYGVGSSTNNLFRLNISTQTVTLVGSVSGLPVGGYGAAYSTSDGKLYISENTSGNIYIIDLTLSSPTASLFASGPNASNNDGAKVTSVGVDGVCLKDTDTDGILDYLDTDSDNDGCPDAIEGGANFTAVDINANNRLTGGVDANGVPTVAGAAGQTVGYSITATRTVVLTSPSNQSVALGAPTSFTISARADQTTEFNAGLPVYNTLGNVPATRVYKWYLGDPDAGGVALTNTGVYTGVTTATLNISNTTGLGGSIYYVVVTNTNNTCIREIRNATLIDLCATISGTISAQTNVNCFGASTGALTVTGSGGTAPYQYSLNGGAYGASGTFTGLNAGAKTITVRDANLCTFVVNATITQPAAALVVTPTLTQPSCFAFGSISLNTTGGTSPYTYNWSDVAGTNNPKNRSGLSAGTYSVTVTDTKGCTIASGTLTLNAPTGCTAVNVCKSDAASVFSVTPDPSITTYTWTVPSGAIIVNGQGTSQITINWNGVTPGTYPVCVQAANVCGTTAQTCQDVNVIQPTATATTNPVCAGGTIQLFASGGVSYAWSGPNSFVASSANPTILNASAATHNGTYTVTVTDASGCKATASVVVSVNSNPQLSTTVVNAACDLANGSINLTVTGGTPTYTYVWSNGTLTQDLSSIAAGAYFVTVTDAAGCIAQTSTAINNLAGPSLSKTQTNVSCPGGANGAINLSITGGTAPLTILWSDGSTMEDRSGLVAGNYSVSVTDANGCVGALPVVITQPAALQTDFTKVDVACFGASTGSINLVVSGGTGTYSYAWTKNGSPYGGNTQNLSTLSAGTYAVTITDANSCTATTSVTITQPAAALSASAAITNVGCNGAAEGQVALTVTGGTAPYTYSWTGPGGFTASTKDITDRIAGTYNVTITDKNNCTFPLTGIIITQPAALTLASATPTNVSCFGGTNGSINVTISGGTTPYTYAWSNGASVEDPGSLAAGTYTLMVTDAKGCTLSSAPITVGQPALLAAALSVTNAACFGTATGSINLTVSGGTAGFTYLWSNSANSKDLSNILAGTYSVTVTDSKLCTAIATATVNDPAEIIVSGNVTNVLCNGAATGAIDLTATGGTGTLTYAWADGPTSADRTGLLAGTYTVSVTDANTCVAVRSFTITQSSALQLAMSNTNISCFGAADGRINLSVSGGLEPYSYAWSNLATTKDIAGLSAGVYTVVVTDANNCTATLSSSAISQPAQLTVSANLVNNVICKDGSNGSATAIPTGGTAPYSYSWSNGAMVQTPNNFQAGNHTVTITDANFCTASGMVTISQPLVGINLYADVEDASSCGGATGGIDLLVENGTGPFTYVWTGPTAIGNTQDPTNLLAGTYNVVVTDNLGCSATLQVVVGTAPALTVTVGIFNGSCQGADGEAYANASGGVAPYTYAWTPGGGTTQALIGLSNGTYTVIVTDANGCTATASGTVTLPTNCAPPVAVDDYYTTSPGTPVSGTVATNDSDPDNTLSELEFFPLGSPAFNEGTIQWDPSFNGSFVFTPVPGFYGIVAIPYTVCDPTGFCDKAVLYITVNITFAENDINQTPINKLVNGDVLINDTDPQGDTQTVTAAKADTDGDGLVDDTLPLASATTLYGRNDAGAVVVAGQVTLNANGTYTYAPALNFTGDVPFAYTATDNNLNPVSDNATVTIEVIPASVLTTNEPPVANDDTNTTEKDVNVSGNVLPNDHDPDGDPITVTSALADTDGDGSIDDPLTVGTATTVYGKNILGVTVVAGVITLNTNGAYTYDPHPDFVGKLPVIYKISDPAGLMDAATLTITVTENLGNATYANDDANVGPQNVVQTGNILTNDFDPEGNTQTVTTVAYFNLPVALTINGVTENTLQNGGKLVIASNGTYTYTPAPGFVGTEILQYKIEDNGSPIAQDWAILYLTTLPLNVTFAENDINQTPINIPASGNVLTNDTDPQGDNQTVTAAKADTDGDGSVDDTLPLASATTIYGRNDAGVVVVAGQVTLNSNGTYTYAPATGFTGDVPFAYTATDNNLSPASDNATVTIKVIPISVPGVNEPPVANDDTNTTEKDVNVSDNVLPNDSDPDGDPITVTSALADTDGDGSIDDPLTVGTATNVYGKDPLGVTVVAGMITLNSNGSYTLDPTPSFIGELPVIYKISDPAGLMDAATLTITVTENRGNATYANDDANVGPQNVTQTGNILTNDNDPEGNTQTVASAVNSNNTALVVNGVTANTLPSGGTLILAANGVYTYTPASGFAGTERVQYRIVDNGSPVARDTATLYLTTLPVNVTYAENDINQTPINTAANGNVLTNDTDPQGDNQTVTAAKADTDGDGSVDDALPLGTPTTIYGTKDGGMIVVAGSITLNTNGTYSYTPATNFTGDVHVQYTATDNNVSPASDNATLTIEVVPVSIPGVNEPPVANDDTNTTEKDVTVTGNVLPNDSDPDGDPITVTSALADTDGDGSVDDPLTVGAPITVYGKDPAGNPVVAGVITLNPNGTYTFDPTPIFVGELPVTYKISDPAGLMDAANLTITVTENLGNATYANDDANVGPQNAAQTGNVLTNDNDPEGNTQTVVSAVNSLNTALVVDGSTANTLPNGGTLILASNGTYTYTPLAGFVGTEVVRYRIVDNGSPVARDTATLYLTTLPVNNTYAENDINQTPINTAANGNVLTNDTDLQGDNQTVTAAKADTDGDGLVDDTLPLAIATTIYGRNDAGAVVVAGQVTLNANGNYSYTPTLGFTGDVPFVYTATDNNASPASDNATVTIEVIPVSIPGVNEPPVANDDTNTTEKDVTVTGNVLPNDSDPDGDPITVTSALADTDGDGSVDDPLTVGAPITVYGKDPAGNPVVAGVITLNPNGTYTFDPAPIFVGELPVTYKISDPAGLMDAANLTITVTENLGNATYANDDANVGPQNAAQTGNVLTNDNDPEGNTQTVASAVNSSNTALVVNGVTANTLPSGGTLILASNGTYTYTPFPGFVGTERVQYRIVDNGSPVARDTATLYLTTLPVNNTYAENDINQTPINIPANGNVLTNDTDPQGDNQTVTAAKADTDGDGSVDDTLPLASATTIYGRNDAGAVVVAGQVTLNANGTYTYTPALNFVGDVPFAYTATDNNTSPASDNATVTIEVVPVTVLGVNEPPVANDDTNTTEKDVTVTGNVLPNDSDPDGDPITVTSALVDTDGDGSVDDPLTVGTPTTVYGKNPAGNPVVAGQLTLNSNGAYTFDPTPTFVGELPVSYKISDPAGLMDSAVLTITVTENLGNATYANDDANVSPQNVAQTGNVLTNDNDPEGNTQTVASAVTSANVALVVNGSTVNTLPSGGTLILAANGVYTYTPASGFVGTERVQYRIVDNGSPVARDTATLYLTTLPVNVTYAENDINQTPINIPASGNVLTNDTDPQGDNQTVTVAKADTDGDGVVDDNLPLASATTIYGRNDAGAVVVAGQVTLNANGTYTYAPATGFTGDVPFAYTATDNNTSPASDNATVTIEVIPLSIPGVNEPPVANDDTNTTEKDVTVTGNVLPNDSDPDGDPITVTSALADTDGDGQVDEPLTVGTPTTVYGKNPAGNPVVAGVLTLNTNGTYTFDPSPLFVGELPVSYKISDPAGLMDAANLTITVTENLGNATYANDDANVGPQSVAQTGNVLTNDSDPEGNTQTVASAVNSGNTALVVDGTTMNTLPSGGKLVLASNGTYTYTPAAGFAGTERVQYRIVDNGSPVARDTATLYLTTLPLNVTYAENDINQTPVNVTATGNVLTNDTDPQGDNQTVTAAKADTDGDGQVDDTLPLASATTIYGRNDAGTVVVAGQVTLNANGTYTYVPALNFKGDVPFAYTATDNNTSPASDNATVSIEVIPVSTPGTNEPPVANDDTNTTEKDVTVTGNVLPNDSDPDGDPITVTSALVDTDGDGQVDEPLTVGTPTTVYGKNPAGNPVVAGILTLNSNGTYTFDPTPVFIGELPVSYKISDPAGLMDAAILNVTVTENLGNATYANDDANVSPQNVAQTGNVLTNDNDPEGNTQTVSSAVSSSNTALVVDGTTMNTLPSGGKLVLASNGTYTYTPFAGFVGTERVQYRIVDNGSPVARDTATLYLTTLPVNNTFAENDINQTPINTAAAGNVLTNDTDLQGDNQTVTAAKADTDGDGQVDDLLPLGVATTVYGRNDAGAVVVAGQVTLNANGTYNYVPALNFKGDVPFAYTATDNNLSPASDNATVTIEVVPASVPGTNEPPVANDDTNTTERDVTVTGNVLPNDSDPDGDPITVTSALVDTDGDGSVDDPLTVGTPTTVYGKDPEGDPVVAGQLTLNPNGSYTFDPNPLFIGELPLSYKISDPVGLMDVATLTITVTENLGNATYANDDANVGPQNVVQTGNVLTNDSDPEGNTQTVASAVSSNSTALVVDGTTMNTLPSGGKLVLASNGIYTYTPFAGFVGTERIQYRIVDNGSPVARDTATLYLTTLPVNVTYAENDINQTPVNVPAAGNVLTNDTDPQGDNQTVTAAKADTDGDSQLDDVLPLGVATTIYGRNDAGTLVVAGQVTLNANGSYTYTPATGFTGDVPFAYTATDNNTSPASDNATVNIEVIPLSTPGTNEPPVANDDTNTTEKDVTVTGNVLPNDSDPDGDPITVTSALVDTDGDGSVDDPLTLGTPTTVYGKDPEGDPIVAGVITLNPNGTYTFDPNPLFIGELPLSYKISDPAGLMDSATLTITVTENLGNATYANDDANTGPEGVAQTGNILTNDSDPEGNTQTVTSAINSSSTALVVDGTTMNTLPSGGKLVLASNGTYTYTPFAGFVGTERIQYRIVDNGSPVARDTATLYLTTLPVNCVSIETWVYLEGAAVQTDGSANYSVPMRTNLNDLGLLPGQTYDDLFLGSFYTPAGQPFNVAPWNYNGTEGDGYDSDGMVLTAKANYPSTVVDWVLVSLRDNPNGTGGPVCQAAALLHKDGHIEFVNQFQCCGLNANQSYYLVIEHRNHLIVMSHQPVAIVNGKISYDFRTQQSYVDDPFGFGSFSGQKQILPGVFSMFAGNGNQTLTNASDTDINFDDRTFWEILNGTIARYRNSDYNLNGDTNFNDRRVWELNNGKFTSVPRN